MTLGKFQRPTGTGAAPAKKKSRYAGIQAAQPRDPMPHAGAYRFKVLECSEGNNPGKGTDSFKAKLEIVAIYDDVSEHRVGQTVAFIQLLSGKGGPAGLARTKAFVMGAAGYDDEGEYDAFDPDGEFIDACTGAQNQYATDGYTIVGRLVDCQVLRGNATADGTDYYRDFAWCPVPEAEQTGA